MQTWLGPVLPLVARAIVLSPVDQGTDMLLLQFLDRSSVPKFAECVAMVTTPLVTTRLNVTVAGATHTAPTSNPLLAAYRDAATRRSSRLLLLTQYS